MIYAFYCIAERDQVKYMLITIGAGNFHQNFTTLPTEKNLRLP